MKQGFSGSRVKDSEESAKLKLDKRREESGDCQGIDEYKTGVKYSYYAILILDTVQPIVNSSQRMKSYRKSRKLMEGTTSFYVILRHTRVVWSMSHNGGIWSSVECSGRFWMMVQGK